MLSDLDLQVKLADQDFNLQSGFSNRHLNIELNERLLYREASSSKPHPVTLLPCTHQQFVGTDVSKLLGN
jgi:hypothetical protein